MSGFKLAVACVRGTAVSSAVTNPALDARVVALECRSEPHPGSLSGSPVATFGELGFYLSSPEVTHQKPPPLEPQSAFATLHVPHVQTSSLNHRGSTVVQAARCKDNGRQPVGSLRAAECNDGGGQGGPLPKFRSQRGCPP